MNQLDRSRLFETLENLKALKETKVYSSFSDKGKTDIDIQIKRIEKTLLLWG